MRATFRRLVLVLLVAGALCVPATGAWARAASEPVPGLGVRLLEGPADNLDDPRAHDYIIDHVAPGTTISRRIGFSNGDERPIDLSFYAAGADIGGDAFAVLPGREGNELTSWITFSTDRTTVAPGGTVPITVTIAVPSDASTGERYAAALAERSVPPPTGRGVTTVSRVGVRIYLSVGPGGAPRTSFSIDQMTARRDHVGNPVVTATVHNTGERAVDLSGTLDLTNGPSSLTAGPFHARGVATLAPAATGSVSVTLDPELPAGPWDAHLTVVSGLTSEEATTTLTFPAAKGSSGPPSSASTGGGGPLLLVGAGLLAALLIAAIVALAWRRRGPRATAPT